jgi:hypothetical protein
METKDFDKYSPAGAMTLRRYYVKVYYKRRDFWDDSLQAKVWVFRLACKVFVLTVLKSLRLYPN